MGKFKFIKQRYIEKNRKKFRTVIMEEQKNIWSDNSIAGLPHPSDSSLFKRIKLLNKFFLLSKAMRNMKGGVVRLDDSNLVLQNKLK